MRTPALSGDLAGVARQAIDLIAVAIACVRNFIPKHIINTQN